MKKSEKVDCFGMIWCTGGPRDRTESQCRVALAAVILLSSHVIFGAASGWAVFDYRDGEMEKQLELPSAGFSTVKRNAGD